MTVTYFGFYESIFCDKYNKLRSWRKEKYLTLCVAKLQSGKSPEPQAAVTPNLLEFGNVTQYSKSNWVPEISPNVPSKFGTRQILSCQTFECHTVRAAVIGQFAAPD